MSKFIKYSLNFVAGLAMIIWSMWPLVGIGPIEIVKAATDNATVSSQPADYNTADIFRGTSMAFAMTVFGLRDTDGPDDTLDSVKVTVQGTATSAEIASLKVYQENGGNITFDGVETLLGTQTTVNVGSATTILTSTTTLATSATLYYVVATLAGSGLTGGHNFRIDVPVDSLTVSGTTKPTTAFTGGRYATIDIGGGMMQLCVQEAMYIDATTVDVRFSKVVNSTAAQTTNKYTFGGGTISGNPTSATLQPDNMTVRLVKSGATFVGTGRDTVTVSSTVTDLADNPNQMTMPVYIMSGGGGGQSMAVISEVQIAGGGTASTTDEFIELYNPSMAAFDLNAMGVRLHIVGADGTDSDKPLSYVSATSTIAAKGFFLITSATNYDGAATADATYIATTTPSLEDNGAVYISFATTTNSGVIDKVGWGTSTVFEGGLGVNTSFSAVSWGPANNGSIERKANSASTAVSMFAGGVDASYGNSYDTSNNYGDFVIQTTSTPQNTSSGLENPGNMAGYGSGNMLPMIMHMSVMRAIKGDSTLDVAARMSDDSGTLAAANTALYYCASGSGTACDVIGEYTAVVGSSLGSGYFKFSIPSTVRNGAIVDTNDVRYILKATDPVDGTKVIYMSQSPQADMTCQSGTCNTAQIFANPFMVDVITSDQATTYGCNQTISGTIQSGGSNLDGVYVFLEGTAISTTTGLSGIFSFANVCPGVFQIIGAKSGYMDAMYQASAGEIGITMSMGQGFSGGGDYSKPHVQFSMPGDMMQGFPIQENIYVVFTKEMDATTINGTLTSTAANIYLTTDGSSVVSGTMTYYSTNSGRPAGSPPDNYLLAFNPATDLTKGTNYTLVIKSNVISTNGQPLEGNKPGGGHTLNFTTFFDTTGGTFGSGASFPPYIVGTSPGNGAFNVALNTQINITFSEAMNSSSINATNIKMYTVTSPNTTSETETVMATPTVTLDTTGKIALVNPGIALTASRTYRVKVFGACQSAKGISMAMSTTVEMFRFNFDTGMTIDVTAPTIIGTYPSNGGTDIPVSVSAINIGFSEAMDPATINSNTILLKQGNTSLTATVEYDVGQRAANILSATALTPGGTYIIEVVVGDSGVSDIAGVHLADQSSTLAGTQNYSATFTVSTTADTDSPSIQFARCDDFSCAITFSEPMNSAKVGETAYDSGYSVLKKTNYEIRQAPLGTTSWGGVATVSLTSAVLEYDQINNTIKINGLALNHSGQDFQVKVSNAGDRFINASNATVHQIGGATGYATFVGPIQDSSTTGGMMGPGGPGPMMGPPTISGGTAAMGGSGGFDYGGNWEKPTNVMPMNMTAGKSTTYFVEFPATQAIPAGGSIKLTFPTGTDVASAQLVSEAQSMMNKDINGPALGTVKIAATESSGGVVNDGISISVSSRMVTATIDASNSASQAGDMIRFDVKGIVNPTVARSFDTNGYTVDIKTFNVAGALLDSMTSFPFFINAAGAYTLNGVITAAGANTSTARIYLGSSMTGPNETTVTFSGGTASYSFTGLSAGDYFLNTEPTITLGSTDYTGYVTPDPVFVNSVNCPGSVCTKNFSFTKQDNSSAYELTINIIGDFRTVSGISATDRNIDVFASSPSGFAVKTVTLADTNYTAGSPYSTKIYLSAVSNWSVGFGPAMPKGTMTMGPRRQRLRGCRPATLKFVFPVLMALRAGQRPLELVMTAFLFLR